MARGLPTLRLTMVVSAMPVMEVLAMLDTADMAMARGLLTLMPTMADSAMPAMEALATPDMEATAAMARGLPILRLTMVVLAMLVTEVLAMLDTEDMPTARGLLTLMPAMPVTEVLATPDMEDTHTASKQQCPKLSRELQPTELLNLNYKNFYCSDSTRFQNVNSLLAFINRAISGKYI